MPRERERERGYSLTASYWHAAADSKKVSTATSAKSLLQYNTDSKFTVDFPPKATYFRLQGDGAISLSDRQTYDGKIRLIFEGPVPSYMCGAYQFRRKQLRQF